VVSIGRAILRLGNRIWKLCKRPSTVQEVLTQNGTCSAAGLSLSAGCRQNSPAEKEVIAGWILVSDQLVKDNKRFLGYARTII